MSKNKNKDLMLGDFVAVKTEVKQVIGHEPGLVPGSLVDVLATHGYVIGQVSDINNETATVRYLHGAEVHSTVQPLDNLEPMGPHPFAPSKNKD